MTSSSIAIVVSPNILRAPRDDFAVTMSNMGHAHSVAKALITHVRINTCPLPLAKIPNQTSVPRHLQRF